MTTSTNLIPTYVHIIQKNFCLSLNNFSADTYLLLIAVRNAKNKIDTSFVIENSENNVDSMWHCPRPGHLTEKCFSIHQQRMYQAGNGKNIFGIFSGKKQLS